MSTNAFDQRSHDGRLLRVCAGLLLSVVGSITAVVGVPTLHSVGVYGVEVEAPFVGAQVGPTSTRRSSGEVAAEPFTTIGIRVPARPTEPIRLRWRDDTGWSSWVVAEFEIGRGADLGSPEGRSADPREVSTPLWVGTGVGYEVEVPAGIDPERVEVLLVREVGNEAEPEAIVETAGAQTGAGQPAIHTRSEWGARPPAEAIGSAASLKLAVVHHSAGGNEYSRADVPAVIRSIQAFHIDGRGWSDIGYNFVVDRFGGIWEGRSGSLDGFAIGAHAQGFNTSTVGVVSLGDHNTVAPSDLTIESISDVIAWRSAGAGIDPAGTVTYVSGGSPTIAAGVAVTLPTIVGHRDVGATDCPGDLFYPRLAGVRSLTASKVQNGTAPRGVLEASAGPASLLIAGWAFDPSSPSAQVDVHVYVGAVGYNLGPAGLARGDLGGSGAGGSFHGFVRRIDGVSPGRHDVCAYGINIGPGSNSLIACRTVEVRSGPPSGLIDGVFAGPDGSLGVQGWALDPDTSDPVDIHVYLDGVGVDLGPTPFERPDLAASSPLFGGRHGFAWTRSGIGPGSHEVCVYAINLGPGWHSQLGCRTVVVPSGSPIGIIDRVQAGPDGRIEVAGWTIDPDSAGSIPVHVYVDAAGVDLGPTSGVRPDLADAFPGFGSVHGFEYARTGVPPGRHLVCVYAINIGRGGTSVLGCASVVVPGGSPIGVIDAANGGAGVVEISGWTIDPDVSAPIGVHVYVGADGHDIGPAAVHRPDLAIAFPPYGARHGYVAVVAAGRPGPKKVCAYAINQGSGANSLLDCRTVTTT